MLWRQVVRDVAARVESEHRERLNTLAEDMEQTTRSMLLPPGRLQLAPSPFTSHPVRAPALRSLPLPCAVFLPSSDLLPPQRECCGDPHSEGSV